MDLPFQLTAEFKEKRKLVDELKDELQLKIADYSKMAESGKKTQQKETPILHRIIERKKFIVSTTEGIQPRNDVSHGG